MNHMPDPSKPAEVMKLEESGVTHKEREEGDGGGGKFFRQLTE
jgi:hypothetical protein